MRKTQKKLESKSKYIVCRHAKIKKSKKRDIKSIHPPKKLMRQYINTQKP